MHLEVSDSDAVHRDLTSGSWCDRRTGASAQLRSQCRTVPDGCEDATTIGLLRVTTGRVAGADSPHSPALDFGAARQLSLQPVLAPSLRRGCSPHQSS
jgi:hypothetical protein